MSGQELMEDVAWQPPEQRAAPLLALGSRQAAAVAQRPPREGLEDGEASVARAAPGDDAVVGLEGPPTPEVAARGRRGVGWWSCLRRLWHSAACCQSWAVVFSASLDRSALRFVGMSRDRVPPEALREARRVRPPLICMTLLTTTALFIQLYCMVAGWYFLVHGLAPPCQPLFQWLLCYCITLVVFPFCFIIAGPLLMWYWVRGVMIQRAMSNECYHAAPTFWSFVDQVALLGLTTCIFVVAALGVMMWAMRRAAIIRRRWGSSGATSQAIIERVFAAPRPQVPIGTECVICLEVADDATEWCSLHCGHMFHEQCLREWLTRARRCPLCRLDLHAAYWDEESESAPASGNEVQTNV